MPSRSAVRGMFRTDARRLLRDRFLIGMAVYIAAIAVVMRWALPWIGDELAERVAFDLTPYFPLIVSHLVIQLAPLAGGMIGGFLLLESRESQFVKAMLVTPVPLRSYLALLCAGLLLSAISLTLFQSAVIGMALPPWPALLCAGLAGAPAGIFMTLFVGAVADNKTEAFAYLKICGTLPLLPTAAYFLPEPWQWLAAIYPPYWASKAYWVAESGGSWPLWVLH
jgi:fluoroquinolone transport system permease protein